MSDRKNINPNTGEFDFDSFQNPISQESGGGGVSADATGAGSNDDDLKWLNEHFSMPSDTGGAGSDQGALGEMGRKQYERQWVGSLGEGFGKPEITRSGEQSFGGVYGEVPAETADPIPAETGETFERAPPGFSMFPERMPIEKRTVSTLTNAEIMELAKSPKIPESWSSTKDTSYSPLYSRSVRDSLMEKYGINYWVEIEDIYSEMSQIERAAFLVDARNLAADEARYRRKANAIAERVGEMAVSSGKLGLETAATMSVPGGYFLRKYGVPYIEEKYGDVQAFIERVNRLEQTEAELEKLRQDMDELKRQE